MSRLTLEWHLRGIVKGTVDPVCVGAELSRYSDALGEWIANERYYADPFVEGNTERRPRSEADSYTTGFTQWSGDFCDIYNESMARHALRSDDPVAYLDAVAHDPCAPYQCRVDATELLSHHIMPLEYDVDGEMQFPERYWETIRCPNCHEGECLFDPDRPNNPARCLACGNDLEEPSYP